ncbi:cyclin-dependent protein kinase inhibitor SMR2 [Mercurialis annua]|uniref:cyclin-dependent protein kinase inhibitor SMR2 n=1 Tax=Mercurialis annua TaxID=3986 RepID=UPI002160A571|nr:cyclin-dependent protein kinase inhibitor SMR2 [Mercurialis annua]
MSKDHHHQLNPQILPKLQEFASQHHEENQEDGDDHHQEQEQKQDHNQEKQQQEEEECKTPTSSDHKIPKVQSCPPTPKKKKPQKSLLHKRKFPEFEFFEATNKEEVYCK